MPDRSPRVIPEGDCGNLALLRHENEALHATYRHGI
jgi:hypothetical protein